MHVSAYYPFDRTGPLMSILIDSRRNVALPEMPPGESSKTCVLDIHQELNVN